MENLQRPAALRTVRGRASDWVTWFGLGRLLASAAAVVVVCAGAFWLTRAPQPPTEAALPRATTGTAPPTLPPPAPAGADAAGRVTVHVTGAVARPGVYELPDGARVQDVIELAGGATDDGDPDSINLAAVLGDGARVYVPVIGEDVPLAPVAGESAPPGPVDVNRASIAELDSLPGVGPSTAAAIVTERERNGPFVSVDDLDRVPGIGPVKLDGLRELVTT